MVTSTEQPSPPPSTTPHHSSPGSPSLSRPRTPRTRNSPRLQPGIHRSSSYLSASGTTASAEGSPHLSPMADPHHHRAPSLGDLHQELESEQEGRVNRLLGMIRQQQAQLDTASAAPSTSSTRPQQPRSRTPSTTRPNLAPAPSSTASSNTAALPHRSSITTTLPHLSLGKASIRGGGGPAESPDWLPRDTERDELAFYEAETASMQRENRMLKVKVAELEALVGRTGEVGMEGEQGSRGRR